MYYDDIICYTVIEFCNLNATEKNKQLGCQQKLETNNDVNDNTNKMFYLL